MFLVAIKGGNIAVELLPTLIRRANTLIAAKTPITLFVVRKTRASQNLPYFTPLENRLAQASSISIPDVAIAVI